MKNLKKIIVTGLLALSVATTAFATSAYNNPAEIVAGLTGRSVESVIDERHDTGKSFGTIAKEAGKLDGFKAEILELRKDQLAARVADGRLTQEQADKILASIEERQALCDGEGYGYVVAMVAVTVMVMVMAIVMVADIIITAVAIADGKRLLKLTD